MSLLKVPYICPHPLCDVVQHYPPGRQIVCDGKYGKGGELRHAAAVCKESR